MSDLISRQAALDALDHRLDSIPMELTAEILSLRRDLRNLPSADRPKTKEDLAKAFTDNLTDKDVLESEAYAKGYADGLKEQIDKPKRGEWTDCTGCKFVGSYDTEYPCANCTRKTKDYYCDEDVRGDTE